VTALTFHHRKAESDMRKLACLLLLAGSLIGIGGCSSPAYTGPENVGVVLRTWEYERGQMIDDVMYELMFAPPSRSTVWNLR
jgi:hypothetical protein